MAIDGKTVRNSGFLTPYHIVTAWRSDYKLAVAQVKVEEKSKKLTENLRKDHKNYFHYNMLRKSHFQLLCSQVLVSIRK